MNTTTQIRPQSVQLSREAAGLSASTLPRLNFPGGHSLRAFASSLLLAGATQGDDSGLAGLAERAGRIDPGARPVMSETTNAMLPILRQHGFGATMYGFNLVPDNVGEFIVPIYVDMLSTPAQLDYFGGVVIDPAEFMPSEEQLDFLLDNNFFIYVLSPGAVPLEACCEFIESICSSADSTYASCMGSGTGNYAAVTPGIFGLGTYPNPANPNTTVSFSLPIQSSVELSVLSLRGESIERRPLGNLPAGPHEVPLDCSGYASGNYVLVLSTGNGKSDMQMICVLK